jgi:hypothetical protein
MLHNLYISEKVISIMKSKSMGWMGKLHSGGIGYAYKIVNETPEMKRPFGRSKHRWKYSIKVVLKEVWRGLCQMAQGRSQPQARVNTVMNLRVT